MLRDFPSAGAGFVMLVNILDGVGVAGKRQEK
jgi:hypothetical protein